MWCEMVKKEYWYTLSVDPSYFINGKYYNKFIRLNILKEHVSTIASVDNPYPAEPLGCPGILESVYHEEFAILLGNLNESPLTINLKISLAYLHRKFLSTLFYMAHVS